MLEVFCYLRYKEGMLRAKVDDYETINLIEGAAAGMVATIDALGTEAVQDWEVSVHTRTHHSVYVTCLYHVLFVAR